MEQGKEEHPTLYLYRNLEKPYHIDYCFASADLLEKVKQVEIGSYENWFMHSDHSPVCVLFEM
jgi:exonuclease III